MIAPEQDEAFDENLRFYPNLLLAGPLADTDCATLKTLGFQRNYGEIGFKTNLAAMGPHFSSVLPCCIPCEHFSHLKPVVEWSVADGASTLPLASLCG